MLQLLKNFYHLAQATIANLYYGFPSRKLKVIGVTGTDGKTTTTHLIYHILKSSGKKASMISSVYANIAGKKYDTGFHVTTPDVFPLQRFLQESAKFGDEYFILETTSHALSQNRVSGIKFYAGVLTNITHEHLDFHKNIADYVKTKSTLLNRATISIANSDDPSFPLIKKYLKKKIHTYGLKGKAYFDVDISKKLGITLATFNKYNYLAAFSLCSLLDVKVDEIISSLKTFSLPAGRLELVTRKPITVIVDFAHTPHALQSVLKTVRDEYLHKGKRLIHLFGAAGQRDRSKRPLMGEKSARFANIVILTEEDYRSENPSIIAGQIAQGLKKKGFHYADSNKSYLTNKIYLIRLDRKKAIEKAIEIAKPGDVVITTGKGHEKSLCRGKIEYPWDEKKAILDAIKRIYTKNS